MHFISSFIYIRYGRWGMKPRPRPVKALIAAVILSLAAIALSSPAGAAPPAPFPGPVINGGNKITIKFTFQPSAQLLAKNPAAAAIVIECDLIAQNPHKAKHGTGNDINAQDSASCDHYMFSMQGTIDLYRNGVNVAYGSSPNKGWNLLLWNAAELCHRATYWSEGYWYGVAPPGYTPTNPQAYLQSLRVTFTTC
jgi:hypothetical protein